MTALSNSSFEGGAWRKTFNGQEYGEISVPVDWTAFWDEAISRPEMKVISRDAPYLDPPRVFEGKQAVQWFTFYRAHRAGLFQRVTGLEAGGLYEFSAMVQAWYSQFDDPHKSEWDDKGTRRQIHDGAPGMGFRLGIDPTGDANPFAATVVWHGRFYWYDAYARINAVFEADGDAVTLFIESRADNAFKHCDAYVDMAELRRMDKPAPVECYGEPRVDYARVYNVWPPDATPEQRREVARYCAEYQETGGPSYDDAGIGDLSNKTARLWYLPVARHDEFTAWYKQWYPGTRVLFAGGAPTPPPPPPPPPPPIKPVVPNGIIVGWGTIGGQGQEPLFRDLAAQNAAPPTAKFVQDLGAAAIVRQYAPATVIIGRKIDVIYNGQEYNAEWFKYELDPITQAEARMELLRETMIANPAVTHWEIVNEQQPAYPESIVAICTFFKRAMTIAAGWGKRLALFSFSTGNPLPQAWDYALTTGVFEQAKAGGHVVALHEYGLWPRDANSHLLRFKALYALLVPLDLAVPLYITEYGVPREDWNTTNKMTQIREYDAQLARLPYVGGVHIYVNPWDSPYNEYPRIYPEYSAYAVTVRGRVNG